MISLWSRRRPQRRLVPPDLAAPAPWVPRNKGVGPRDAVLERVEQLAQSGALDAGNGDVLDSWLDGLRGDWHAELAAERTNRVIAAEQEVARLDALAVRAQRVADAAAADLTHTERALAIVEKRVLGPGENEPADPRERRRRPRPTLEPLEGLVRPWPHRILISLLVLLAAAGDLATFYLVLAREFRDGGEFIVWTLTVAFASASVGLMHSVGRALKDLREARGGLGRPAIALMLVGWVALGGVAFFFRLESNTVTASEQSPFGGTTVDAAAASHHALMSAVLLAGLFLASGLLAFYAGFSEHHPQMTTYLALRKRLPEQRERAATTAEDVTAIQQRLNHVRGEEDRVARWAADGVTTADAEIAALKELVRVQVAAYLGQPAATSGLTSGRRPGQDRSPGPDDGSPGVPAPRPGEVAPSAPGPSAVRRIPRTEFPVLTGRTPNGNGVAANGHNGAH